MIKTIGVDPGLAATGVGIVTGISQQVDSFSYGCIKTSPKTLLPNRLDQIFSKLQTLLKNEKPDVMFVEDIFSLNRYPKSGITLGKVTGVILLAGFQNSVPVSEIPVREAKKILTGSGNANKIQLEQSVRHFLNINIPIRPYHASDALALAIIGLFRFSS